MPWRVIEEESIPTFHRTPGFAPATAERHNVRLTVKDWKRLSIAFLAAPPVGSAAFTVCLLPQHGTRELLALFVTLIPLAFAVAVLAGLPIHLFLRAKGIRSPWAYLALGAALAIAATGFLWPWYPLWYASSAIAGLAASLVFWFIVARNGNETQGSHRETRAI